MCGEKECWVAVRGDRQLCFLFTYHPANTLTHTNTHSLTHTGKYVVERLSTGEYFEPGTDAPHAVFGSAPKLMTATENLSATPYVSPGHSLTENAGVHSPGPARCVCMCMCVNSCHVCEKIECQAAFLKRITQTQFSLLSTLHSTQV